MQARGRAVACISVTGPDKWAGRPGSL